MRYSSLNRVKNDFLTIPDAPNYEINSQLILRNKSTGKILKPIIRHNTPCYTVYSDGKPIHHSAISARNQAVAAANPSDSLHWTPVPSLNCKYEFGYNGKLRNASSKRVLKLIQRQRFIGFAVSVGNKACRHVSLSSLMWEIHGVVPQSRRSPVSCSAFKNGVSKKFDSLRACSRFLADYVFSAAAAFRLLVKRQPLIGGWNIKYAPRDFWSADKEAVSKEMLRGVGK